VIWRHVHEQNPHCKQKSRTIYVNNARKLWMYYVHNKNLMALFFCRGSRKYVWITCVAQFSFYPVPHHYPG